MAGQIRYDLSNRCLRAQKRSSPTAGSIDDDGEEPGLILGLHHNNREMKLAVLWAPPKTRFGKLARCRRFSRWGWNAAAQRRRIPQIKSGVRGEGASHGQRRPEQRDGLRRGPCECSLFWRGDNPSISTGRTCQSTARWRPRHPLWVFLSVLWRAPAFNGSRRPGHWMRSWGEMFGKSTVFCPLCKTAVLSSSFGGKGEGGLGWFGKAETTSSLAVIKCTINWSGLKHLKIQTRRAWSSTMQVEHSLG